jgi:hypothetical protein
MRHTPLAFAATVPAVLLGYIGVAAAGCVVKLLW